MTTPRCHACNKNAYPTPEEALDAITTIYGYTHTPRTYPCPYNTHWWHITTHPRKPNGEPPPPHPGRQVRS